MPIGRCHPLEVLVVFGASLAGATLNLAFGMLNHALALPLYFDSILTMVVTALFGLVPGLVTAASTNAVLTIGKAVLLPFVLCNACTALIVAAMRRTGKLESISSYLWMGLWTGLANAVVGSIISAFAFGGITSMHKIDELVSGFVVAGQSLVSSVFLAGALTNLVDKTLSALIAFPLVRALSPRWTRWRLQLTRPSS
jgi:energy-coupling factor transport system substrate-specific component